MEFIQYAYLPKEQNIVSMQVTRPQGYNRAKIHMHDHHELILVTSQAVCRIINNGNEMRVQAPCVILNRAGSFHEVVEVSQDDYDSCVVFFYPQALSGIPKEMRYEKQLFSADLTAVSLSQEQLRDLQPIFRLLNNRPRCQQLPLLLMLFAAIGEWVREGAPTQRTTAAGDYILDVIELLQNGQENLDLSQLARRFHVSQTKLKTDFKRITGLPVMTYKNHVRLEKARLLLESTAMAQAQIAYTCGFFDESYFIRSFRKAYEITPAAYRKRAAKLGQTTVTVPV